MLTKTSVLATSALLAVDMLQVLFAQSTSAQSQAHAPEAPPFEIIVTARKRDERLQDAPISIKAMSGEDIVAAGIKRTEDFIHLTPNRTISAIPAAVWGSPS